MDRKYLYKKASETVEELRKHKREEQSDLRKQKRDKMLSLKRLRYAEVSGDSEPFNLTVGAVISLSRIIRKHGEDALSTLRKLKWGFTQGNLIADTFIAQDGALQSLVRFLTGNDIDLQIESAWCLTNLAGSTRDHAVRILKESGAYLITYLGSSNVLLQDLCAWTLGNLAGDCEECRRIIQDQGAVHPLVHLLNSTFTNVVKSAVFAICNLTRSDDERIFEGLRKSEVGKILFKLFKNSSSSADALTDLAWLLLYCSVNYDMIEYLFSCGINVCFVVEVLERSFELPESVQLVTALIRTLGNMCSGPDQLTDDALRSGFLLKAMTSLLTSSCQHVKKESLWLLSNLTAGSQQSVKAVVNAGLLSIVVELLDESSDIQKESCFVLLNTAYKSEDYLREMLKHNVLAKFLNLLKSEDNGELCLLALQFFDMTFRSFPECREAFEKLEGVVHLEALQYKYFTVDIICQSVDDLLKTYFENKHEIQ